jgi:hypothetical protein
VPADQLPQALFCAQASDLLEAIASHRGVKIYVAEYQRRGRDATAMTWIASRDAIVASELIRVLSSRAAPSKLQVGMEFVPFHVPPVGADLPEQEFREDVRRAEAAFRQMRAREGETVAVLVGSQRVNYMVELMVASLFRAKPFQPATGKRRVPFHLAYHGDDRLVPSCFGSRSNPPGVTGPFQTGLWYQERPGKWVRCPFERDKKDAGIVITVHEPGCNALEMAIFGFSSAATEAMGRRLHSMNEFWPPCVESRGKRIAVHVCMFDLVCEGKDRATTGAVHAENFQIEALSAQVLEASLSR